MDIDTAFTDAAAQLGVGPVSAKFHPYTELKHTWTRDGRRVSFKVSDYLRNAPGDVIESLSMYLLCRAYGKSCDNRLCARYVEYSCSRELWEAAKDTYLGRARNLTFDVKGRYRDLRAVFDYVNSFYFAGKAPEPILAWVCESPRRRLGYYFEPLRLLATNRVLDQETVPRYVLEFVMYHELLHHLGAGDGRALRRVHHTKDFNAQERAFSHYEDAESWLRRLVRPNRR